MEFIRKLISSGEYDRIIAEFPLDSVLVTRKLTLKTNIQFEDSDLEDLNMNTEQFVKYKEIEYWFQLIEYDLTCTYKCLVYLIYLENDFFEKQNNTKTIMEVQEFSFFFDSAFNKLFSLIERVSQLVNCLFSLDLIENKLGTNGVSLKNVQRKLEERGLFVIKDIIVNIDFESESLRKLRNAITHHFHPLNPPYLIHSVVNKTVQIDSRENGLIDKELLSSFQNSINNINDMINMLVGIAVGFFKIECVLIKNKTAVDVTEFRMSFDS